MNQFYISLIQQCIYGNIDNISQYKRKPKKKVYVRNTEGTYQYRCPGNIAQIHTFVNSAKYFCFSFSPFNSNMPERQKLHYYLGSI